MTAALDIVITKAESSKLNDLNLENIPFGKYFTDHMLEATFENGEWSSVEIKPYQPLVCDPSTAVFLMIILNDSIDLLQECVCLRYQKIFLLKACVN